MEKVEGRALVVVVSLIGLDFAVGPVYTPNVNKGEFYYILLTVTVPIPILQYIYIYISRRGGRCEMKY